MLSLFGVCLKEEKTPRNISDYITTLWLFISNHLLEVKKALVSSYSHPWLSFPATCYLQRESASA